MSRELLKTRPPEPLVTIRSADVLEPKDMQKLEELAPELLHASNTITIFRTTTEAICSVLDDVHHPTPASKYHQAKLEQSVMFNCLIENSLDYRETLAKLKIAEAEMKKLVKQRDVMMISCAEPEDIEIANAKIEKQQVKIDRLVYRLEQLRREAKDRLRELIMWSDIKATLKQVSEFDIDNKDTDQLIALTKRYCRETLIIWNDRTSADVGSRINIIGQAITLIRECIRRGLLEKAGVECIQAAMLLGIIRPKEQETTQQVSDSESPSEPAQSQQQS